MKQKKLFVTVIIFIFQYKNSPYGVDKYVFPLIHAPLIGATFFVLYVHFKQYISFHAPLTGCDTTVVLRTVVPYYFNPRTPHMWRRF